LQVRLKIRKIEENVNYLLEFMEDECLKSESTA
jgi:hypothetical protein